MNNEETKLLDEDTRIINDTTDSTIKNEQPEVVINTDTPKSARKAKSNNGKTVAAAAGGFVAGAVAGAAFTASATNNNQEAVVVPEDTVDEGKATEEKSSEDTAAEEKQAEITAEEVKTETPAPEQVILANDEGIRYAHVDADNFNDAFAQARAQVGAGGVFEYDGKLYGTYYADEWRDMSVQERADYQSRVNEVAPSHHSEPSHAAYAHYTAQNDYQSPEVIPTNAEMISEEPVDNEIRVLGVEAVESDYGDVMNVALIDNGIDQAILVDVDNNGTIDVLIHDDNHDGQLQQGEVHDVSPMGIEVADLMQMQAAQQGDLLYAGYDPEMPDYINDADSIMNV